jgi:hypothetical protein
MTLTNLLLDFLAIYFTFYFFFSARTAIMERKSKKLILKFVLLAAYFIFYSHVKWTDKPALLVALVFISIPLAGVLFELWRFKRTPPSDHPRNGSWPTIQGSS